MTAYAIFIREQTLDPAELATYGQLLPATSAGHDFSAVVRHGAFEVLEGPAIEGAVVLKFASLAEAKAWYDSPAYQAAAKHRFVGARYRAFIIEGLD